MNDLEKLKVCENGSIPKINLGRTLDNTTEDKKMEVLNTALQKVAFGGRVSIQGIHLDSFCKDYLFNSNVNLKAILGLNSVTSVQEVHTACQQHGLTIASLDINNGLYTIEATK